MHCRPFAALRSSFITAHSGDAGRLFDVDADAQGIAQREVRSPHLVMLPTMTCAPGRRAQARGPQRAPPPRLIGSNLRQLMKSSAPTFCAGGLVICTGRLRTGRERPAQRLQDAEARDALSETALQRRSPVGPSPCALGSPCSRRRRPYSQAAFQPRHRRCQRQIRADPGTRHTTNG